MRDRTARATSPPSPKPSPAQQQAFADWLRPLLPDLDVVMVHEPALAQPAIDELRHTPPSHPIVFLVGHTHVAQLDVAPDLVVLNGGTVGAGGSGNLAEGQPIGLAVLTFEREPAFKPVAADLVEVDPGDGSARAVRRSLAKATGS